MVAEFNKCSIHTRSQNGVPASRLLQPILETEKPATDLTVAAERISLLIDFIQ